MSVQPILQLGNPGLRVKCPPVRQADLEKTQSVIIDLQETLDDFRQRNGFGRAIAAPQIGVCQRIVVVRGDTQLVLINPVIVRWSKKMMVLWDDCFSFPNIIVKVKRHIDVDVRYQDPDGKRHTLRAEGSLSELLQHELDHLDGILAIDRAIDSRHIIFRSELEKWEKHTVVPM